MTPCGLHIDFMHYGGIREAIMCHELAGANETAV